MSDQQTYFNARIKRIKDPKNRSYMDPELGIPIPKRISRQIIKTGNSQNEPQASLGGVIMSVILGLICLMAARYVRFTYAGIDEAGTEANILMAMDCGLAAMMVFFVGGLMRLKKLAHMGGQAVGIGVMLVAMHNLVWFFPAEFEQVYSKAYVQQIKDTTEPLSIYVNGETVITL